MATICIDARRYYDYGIGRYVRNLIRSLADLKSHHRYSLVTTREDGETIKPPAGWKKQTVSYGKYSISEFLMLGRIARRWGVDVFHEPHYTLPLGLGSRSVVTIHDLIHIRFPQFYGLAPRTYASMMIKHAAQNAAAIITDSEYTRQDLLEFTRISPARVHAIHCGVDSEFKTVPRSRVSQFRKRYNLQSPYLLYTGNVKPHKNITTLISCFPLVREHAKDVELVFVGGSPYDDQSLNRQLQRLQLSQTVRALGNIPQEDLVSAYNGAAVTVLPSLYEGFGFAAVEAMACGTPVVSSNAASLPEVAGNAALTVAPTDKNGMADAIVKVLTDKRLRIQLVKRGRENARRFSWKTNARRTLSLYEELLGQT